MPRGFFISFEGLDGSGKTTQLKRLSAALTLAGLPVVSLRQPGGTPLGDQVRGLLLDSRSDGALGGIAPLAELGLMFADRAQAIRDVIGPALDRGDVVLCDRFTDSSEAYQGAGRGLGSRRVLALHRELCGRVQPDLTLLLLPPLSSSLSRARRRNERHLQRVGTDENRFERETNAFYERVYSSYQEIAAREPQRVVIIESVGSIDEIEAEVRTVALARLSRRVEQAV